jgi:hypothetical protein
LPSQVFWLKTLLKSKTYKKLNPEASIKLLRSFMKRGCWMHVSSASSFLFLCLVDAAKIAQESCLTTIMRRKRKNNNKPSRQHPNWVEA